MCQNGCEKKFEEAKRDGTSFSEIEQELRAVANDVQSEIMELLEPGSVRGPGGWLDHHLQLAAKVYGVELGSALN